MGGRASPTPCRNEGCRPWLPGTTAFTVSCRNCLDECDCCLKVAPSFWGSPEIHSLTNQLVFTQPGSCHPNFTLPSTLGVGKPPSSLAPLFQGSPPSPSLDLGHCGPAALQLADRYDVGWILAPGGSPGRRKPSPLFSWVAEYAQFQGTPFSLPGL